MATLRVHFLAVLALHLLLLLLAPRSGNSYTWGHCSTKCKSRFCGEAPLLRYGKYCGVFYTGCAGQAPCDGLDSCCETHDHCVGHSDYLNVTCNQNLLDCIAKFAESGAPSFDGNTCNIGTVENTITFAIKAGVWVGKGFGDGPPGFNTAPDRTPGVDSARQNSIP